MDTPEKNSTKLSNATLLGPLQPEHFADIPFVSKEILADFIENGPEVIENSYPYFLGVRNSITVTPEHFVFEAIDDSMEPSISRGDKVLGQFIRKEELQSIKEGMYILLVNDQLLMRRIREKPQGTNGILLLYNDDDQAAPTVAFLSEISAIWRAQGSNVSVS